MGRVGWSGEASGPVALLCWSWLSSHCVLVQITRPACTTVQGEKKSMSMYFYFNFILSSQTRK